MIRGFKHSETELHKALLLSDSDKNAITDYVHNLSINDTAITLILELVQSVYGLRGLVFASLIIGQINNYSFISNN